MPNKQTPADPLSGATVGEFQPDVDTAPRADLVTLPPVQPNMTVHDPVTFAGLTGQRMLEMKHAQNLLVTPDEINAIEDKALEDANNYHRTVAEQAQKERSQLGARQAAVTPAVTKEGTPIPGSSIAEQEETVRRQSAEAQKQWEQTSEIQKLGGDDLAKLDAMTNGYDAVNNLGDYFNKMMEKPHLGVGGQIKSLGGHLQVFADATSPEALAFSRASDAALVPIGRGVMGETGASPTKESMIELAKTITMPRVQDDEATGNQGVFQLKQRIMQNLQNFRDNRANNHFDTTAIDKAIAKYNSNFISPDVQKYNPLAQSNQALVQSGNSAQANASIANLNAGANAGIQNQPVQQPQGQAGAYTAPPSYTPPTPTPLEQGTKEDIAAVTGAAKTTAGLAGSLASGVAGDIGTLGTGAGDVWNWLSNLQVHYPPKYDTTSQQFVGTGQ